MLYYRDIYSGNVGRNESPSQQDYQHLHGAKMNLDELKQREADLIDDLRVWKDALRTYDSSIAQDAYKNLVAKWNEKLREVQGQIKEAGQEI